MISNKKNKPKQKLFVFVLATFHFCGGPFFLESDSPDNNNRKFSHRILVYISSHVLCSIILFQFIDQKKKKKQESKSLFLEQPYGQFFFCGRVDYLMACRIRDKQLKKCLEPSCIMICRMVPRNKKISYLQSQGRRGEHVCLQTAATTTTTLMIINQRFAWLIPSQQTRQATQLKKLCRFFQFREFAY